jgi:uncharacterized protein (DUF983 family)
MTFFIAEYFTSKFINFLFVICYNLEDEIKSKKMKEEHDMAYCSKCGEEKDYQNGKCEKCGFQPQLNQNSSFANDDGGFLWGLLGFCVPIVGLVLWLIWRTERPVTAKAAGMGALVSVILNIVFSIIYVAIVAATIGTGTY